MTKHFFVEDDIMANEQLKKQGKKNREAGRRFELKVRKDLEKKGWIVSKWMNNLDYPKENINLPPEQRKDFKLIPAKHKFRGKGIPMAIGTGFPDFISYGILEPKLENGGKLYPSKKIYEVTGVEAKSKGYLTKEEKAKCKWLLDNHIFSKILIAKKGKKRGEIVYENYMEK